MVIVVKDIVDAADTAAQGSRLFDGLRVGLLAAPDIVVSFAGISTTTSSFVNASFVELLGIMNFDELRRRIRVIASSAQINDMIKRRLTDETLAHA